MPLSGDFLNIERVSLTSSTFTRAVPSLYYSPEPKVGTLDRRSLLFIHMQLSSTLAHSCLFTGSSARRSLTGSSAHASLIRTQAPAIQVIYRSLMFTRRQRRMNMHRCTAYLTYAPSLPLAAVLDGTNLLSDARIRAPL